MSSKITEELRDSLVRCARAGLLNTVSYAALNAIADRIDAEHECCKEENAKLRHENEALRADAAHWELGNCPSCPNVADLQEALDEIARLRELVRDMWFWCYEGHMDSESQEWQMKHIDGVLDRMRELRVEVD